ncbi:MAG: VCBS repeat-containing protein [Planctomycetes bacterium]|nr:VCBS repeat-containing protein [Planctomycetota bacterium]
MHTRRTQSLTPKFAWLAAAALLHCSCGARTRAAEPSAVADSGVDVAEPVALESKPTPQPTKAREVVARVVGTMSVQEVLGQPWVVPVALIQGSPRPRAVFACSNSLSYVWLGIYNFDSGVLERQRIVEVPGRDPMFEDSYFFRWPDFAEAGDLDGDGVDDFVGYWEVADGAGQSWPRARVVAWSSRTLEEIMARNLFGDLAAPPYVRLRPIQGASGARSTSFLIVASQHSRRLPADESVLESAIYSHSLTTGELFEMRSQIDYLNRIAPLVNAGDGAFCGLATITGPKENRELMTEQLGAGCAAWRRPTSELSPKRVGFVEPAPDFDARGVTDLFVTFDENAASCRLFCLAGEDGTVLWSSAAPSSRPEAHHVGDVDRDGVIDALLVQSVREPSPAHSPVVLRSGRTGQVLWDVQNAGLGENISPSAACRVDSDGVRCIVGGARLEMSLLRITARDV